MFEQYSVIDNEYSLSYRCPLKRRVKQNRTENKMRKKNLLKVAQGRGRQMLCHTFSVHIFYLVE